VTACAEENNTSLSTPENTIEQYFYAFKTKNYELAKACFIAGGFLVPKELVKDYYHKNEIIDKYVIGADKAKHLYADFYYDKFGLYNGDVQIVVRNFFKANDYINETIYFLKKINNQWLIYSYTSTDDD
jgi:hypothetical protein